MSGILEVHERRIERLEADLRETRNALDRALHQLSILEGNTMGAVDTAADLGSDPVVSETGASICISANVFWGVDKNGTVRRGPIKLTWTTDHWEGGEGAMLIYLNDTRIQETLTGGATGVLGEVLRFSAGILSLRSDAEVASDSDRGRLKVGFLTTGTTRYALPACILAD